MPDVSADNDLVELADGEPLAGENDQMLDRLEPLWSKARAEIGRRGFALFPAPLDPGNGAFAYWPEGGSVVEFLDVAKRLSVSVIHAHAEHLDRSYVDELSDRLANVQGDAAEAVLRDAEKSVGDIHTVGLAYSHGGATLLWIAEAKWYTELELRAQVEEENARDVDQAGRNFREDGWVRALARNTEFEKARSNEQRLGIAFRLLPELEQMSNDLDPRTRLAADRIVRAAWDLYEAEIRPEQEQKIARTARKALEEGIPKHEVAGGYGMGVSKLNRILAQYGDEGKDTQGRSA